MGEETHALHTNDLSKNQITEGVIWKQLLIFFFPIVFGTFFQQLYNTADAVVVGRFVGKEALACVGGSTGQLVNLVVGFFVGLSSGTTVIIAQYYGAKDKNHLNKTLHTAIAFSIIGSIIISAVSLFATPSMLRLMNTPENLMEGSMDYLHIYFLGIIFVFIYNIGSGILRAVGDSRTPLYFLIVCCIINIVLDLLFVLVFHMGVAGAAYATILSQAVSAVLVIRTLMRTRDMYRLIPKSIRIHRYSFFRILHIGIPAGLESVLYTISNMLIQTSLNSFGTDTVAAWTAFGKMDAFYWMINSAFGISITTFVGQNYGAGKYDRMRKSVRTCLFMAVGCSIIIGTLFLLIGKYIFRLFTGDEQVILIGMQMLTFMAPFYFLFAFIEIFSGALRGTGDVVVPMIMTCGGICLFRVVWILLIIPHHNSLTSILMSYPVSWAITALMFTFYYLKRQKTRQKQTS